MKRFFSILLGVIILFGITGCGEKDYSKVSSNSSSKKDSEKSDSKKSSDNKLVCSGTMHSSSYEGEVTYTTTYKNDATATFEMKASYTYNDEYFDDMTWEELVENWKDNWKEYDNEGMKFSTKENKQTKKLSITLTVDFNKASVADIEKVSMEEFVENNTPAKLKKYIEDDHDVFTCKEIN